MPKQPMIRVRFTDETHFDLPETEFVQVVTQGPSEKQEEGFSKLPGDAKPALYGKLLRTKATALQTGQHMITFRGVLKIEGARRL
jgi:hypothetical protein